VTGDDWPQLLREQGRSMTWLALRVGVIADSLLTAAGWLLVLAAALYFGGHVVAALLS
jgi:hypothetical protein